MSRCEQDKEKRSQVERWFYRQLPPGSLVVSVCVVSRWLRIVAPLPHGLSSHHSITLRAADVCRVTDIVRSIPAVSALLRPHDSVGRAVPGCRTGRSLAICG